MIVQHLTRALEVRETSPKILPTADAEDQIARAWDAERERRPWLRDGEIFAVSSVSDHLVRGAFVPYRWFVARNAEPSIDELQELAVLGVTGRTIAPDGRVAIARRGQQVTQSPGCWEVVPAGGLEPSARHDGRVDVTRMLLVELHEELYVETAEVTRVVPRALVLDAAAGVYDIVIDIYLAAAADAISKRFDTNAATEHDALLWVEASALRSSVAADAVLAAGMEEILALPLD